MSRMISHYSLPITAPEEFWRALGWTVYSNSDEVGSQHAKHGIDALLAIAVTTTGRNDEHALTWAVAEYDRRAEAKTAATAIAREADAIEKLAGAIRSESDQAALDRILSRLTERTQYAVRQQLKGAY